MPVLSKIFIYPVKSLAGIEVSNWPVNKKGLLHDRKWMLVDQQNQFLSQRRLAKMALIKTQLTATELILSTTTTGSISIPINPQGGSEISCTIWKDQCLSKTISPEVDQWLSDFLAIDCKLVYQPSEVSRFVDPEYANKTDIVNFSDGFPFLITSEASLDALNTALEQPIPMERFRPNLVIADCTAYEEDSWREIVINHINFRLPKPCSRCAVPTINTETAQKNKEPLTTLNRLRKWNKKVYFGQNAIHDDLGELTVNDSVKIVLTGTKQPPL